MKPNVLLIVLDTARADALEPYGAARGSSPTVAQMARGGRATPFAVSTASWTVPAHASMFAGLMPRAVGMGQANNGGQHLRATMEGLKDRLLAEVMRRNGYHTVGISANDWIDRHTGFDIGFDEWVRVEGRHARQDLWVGRLSYLRWMRTALQARLDDGAAAAERQLKACLAQRGDRPFFWFVNLLECHSPYLPPKPYNRMGALRRLRAAHAVRKHQGLEATVKNCLGRVDLGETVIADLRDLYADSILQLDAWLARVFEALDHERVLQDTLVIVTSDHGENLGEGRLYGHAFSLDQRLIRVPLISTGPGAFEGRGVTSLKDLPSLIAAGVGITGTPWDPEPADSGVAVAEYDPFVTPEDPRGQQTVDRWGLPQESLRRLNTPMTCVTDGRYKLLRDGDDELLYDLRADPLELSPVRDAAPFETEQPSLLRRFREALDRSDPAAVMVPAAAPAEEQPPSSEDRDLQRRMELLGYM